MSFFSVFRHQLEILLGDHPLPYNMTVYQAIKQFGQVCRVKKPWINLGFGETAHLALP